MDPLAQEILYILGVLLMGVLIGALYGYSSGRDKERESHRRRRALRSRADRVSRAVAA